jgi:hypothetical protein
MLLLENVLVIVELSPADPRQLGKEWWMRLAAWVLG